MRIKSQKDFFAGLLYFAIGVAFAWGATNYNIGDGARMGPGYFPLLLGIVLAVLLLIGLSWALNSRRQAGYSSLMAAPPLTSTTSSTVALLNRALSSRI